MFEQGSFAGIRRRRLAAFRAPDTPVQGGLGVGVGSDVIGWAVTQKVCAEDDVEQRGELFNGAPTVAQHGEYEVIFQRYAAHLRGGKRQQHRLYAGRTAAWRIPRMDAGRSLPAGYSRPSVRHDDHEETVDLVT